ncbi:DUF1641 domain-containing protein [Alicyclobacillus acidocaldarius]|uniref:DUF1641 domain-containing protein n=1 Tax=Alicyclobacillus acidocaldarius subsp. acidocaldarius (strain ATCC 27009 / DSM 446 / BCRC 14685 / JCM 5260 / KCTC 1825 / NBRC 15652 / NCIMB 11725 / NRRL B-14509 / 104-IA) TaxID=521098 RepID=C8WS07_ALIAD|nr:DUF1641 domain-containing protein [Alicyclobacillus acidocaldarius]ACV57441.1 hypothetical protein Aaci_0382 [Alicyclobacillus acidocaldarius subsp. acidocaldarius DSM 446]
MANNYTAEVDGAQRALGDPDFQAKFVRVIERLAEWDEALGNLPTAIAFGRELVQDRESMRYLMESASEEIPLRVDRDTLAALAELLNALPTLVELMRPLLQFAEFAKAVLEDRASVEYLFASLTSEFESMQRMIEEARIIAREAGRIAAEDRTPVTVWSLIRLLKEPVVQKGLRYAKAFVQVAQERADAPMIKNL